MRSELSTNKYGFLYVKNKPFQPTYRNPVLHKPRNLPQSTFLNYLLLLYHHTAENQQELKDTLLVTTCYYLLLLVTTCYYLLLLVTTCYYLLLLVTTCYYLLLLVTKFLEHYFLLHHYYDITFFKCQVSNIKSRLNYF